MKICIIGWYGTETLGDRAILAGTLSLLSEILPDSHILLGSLFPFFSQRTLREDRKLWNMLCEKELCVELFNSSRITDLKKAIKQSDLLLMGGGPLMDLREMHMIAFAFRYARKQNIRTGLWGVGIGPLNRPAYQRLTADILQHTDFAIFRDRASEKEAQTRYLPKTHDTRHAIDPAAYCAFRFKVISEETRKKRQICVNLRQISREYLSAGSIEGNSLFKTLLEQLLARNPDTELLLLPNHYFFFGGDDRFLMNQLKFQIGSERIRVQNHSLSLSETMKTILQSSACVGMRFHSVLFMTLLNGRCRILDYTGEKGKIRNYLEDFDSTDFFGKRVLALDSPPSDFHIFDQLEQDETFQPSKPLLEDSFEVYRSVLREISG